MNAYKTLRKKPNTALKKELLRQYRNRCAYCGEQFGSLRVVNQHWETVNLQWDHLVPFSFSFRNDQFVPACGRCNSKKSNRHILPGQLPKKQAKIKELQGPPLPPKKQILIWASLEKQQHWKKLTTTIRYWESLSTPNYYERTV